MNEAACVCWSGELTDRCDASHSHKDELCSADSDVTLLTLLPDDDDDDDKDNDQRIRMHLISIRDLKSYTGSQTYHHPCLDFILLPALTLTFDRNHLPPTFSVFPSN